MTELHLHLDGSMRPQTIFELASHQSIALPAADAKALRAYLEVPADCPSLTDYLKRFDLPLAVLQTPDALERAVFELRKDGVYLIEVAPGIDIQSQIIDQMGFVPKMDGQPKLMDSRIFREELMGLAK